jgi:hypothetical protein
VAGQRLQVELIGGLRRHELQAIGPASTIVVVGMLVGTLEPARVRVAIAQAASASAMANTSSDAVKSSRVIATAAPIDVAPLLKSNYRFRNSLIWES